MDSITRLEELARRLASYDVPEYYWVIGGVVFVIAGVFVSEWLAVGAVNMAVRLFRLGGKHGPVGRELAAKMLAAVGERRIKIDETTLDTDFRLTSGGMDYQPDTGTLELTEDKAGGASYAGAGLIVLEVGRALQFRSGFPLLFVRRAVAPFVNFAGFAWFVPTLAAGILPAFELGELGPYVTAAPYLSPVLYTITAAMLGLLGFYMLLKIPIDLDAARRGVAAMKRARVFSAGEALTIRIFLGIVLAFTTVATLIVALNFLKGTVPSGSK
ncbi:MAG: zinc metallopeptidase [Candidatus Coatesbacteria bacterium]|nr:MAG: zinc metallopeptidase [Candidatus Coatesbacteria bacterium]